MRTRVFRWADWEPGRASKPVPLGILHEPSAYSILPINDGRRDKTRLAVNSANKIRCDIHASYYTPHSLAARRSFG
jgi:hypothetical protein